LRTVIPGNVSPGYIEALRRNEIDFLRSITASEETAKRAREAWPVDGSNWRPSTPYKTGDKFLSHDGTMQEIVDSTPKRVLDGKPS
jgi:hypothetical protein